jgi:murein DD-endopeptidase MepM/ murein hydrolase activator NlpD
MTDEIDVYKGEKEIITKLKKSTGKITTSLSEAVENLGVSPRVSIQLSEIYAWTIDFFKIQKGDAFNVYYENNYIDGEYIGIGNILAAEFIHKDKSFYAFYYKANKNFGEYFDEEGRTLRKAFLKAPLDFYRISSRYSKNRKHPVTGKWKGHFGTDYAAPRGTPIMSTANGTVQVAGRTRNNGNYVKIRHNGTYTTQYLHMSKIKPGIRKGVYVKQGETIGYVGSTGLATGPHVCYRFWKNGKQVDPYMQKLPPGDPIKESNKKEYFIVKDSLMNILNNTY